MQNNSLDNNKAVQRTNSKDEYLNVLHVFPHLLEVDLNALHVLPHLLEVDSSSSLSKMHSGRSNVGVSQTL